MLKESIQSRELLRLSSLAKAFVHEKNNLCSANADFKVEITPEDDPVRSPVRIKRLHFHVRVSRVRGVHHTAVVFSGLVANLTILHETRDEARADCVGKGGGGDGHARVWVEEGLLKYDLMAF